MSSSRDDFGIAFRSALLQRGAAQKFSLVFLIIVAGIIFFLDIYGFGFMKPIRSIINDGIYRVSLVASSIKTILPVFRFLLYLSKNNGLVVFIDILPISFNPISLSFSIL